jgi:AbrB family looped-hinge helix DNA binding protein
MGRKTPATSVVTAEGQVTIPGEIRRRLGIAPGTNLRFHTEDDKLIAVKETMADPVSRVYGIAGKGKTDAIMARLRRSKIRRPSETMPF